MIGKYRSTHIIEVVLHDEERDEYIIRRHYGDHVGGYEVVNKYFMREFEKVENDPSERG